MPTESWVQTLISWLSANTDELLRSRKGQLTVDFAGTKIRPKITNTYEEVGAE